MERALSSLFFRSSSFLTVRTVQNRATERRYWIRSIQKFCLPRGKPVKGRQNLKSGQKGWLSLTVIEKGPAGNRTQVGGIRTLSDNQLHYRAFRLCCLREVFLSLSTLALTCRLVLIAETEYSTKKSLTSVRKNGVGSDVLI